MAEQTWHVGFHTQAPESVTWPDWSYVRPVSLSERRHIRKFYIFFLFSFMGLFLLSITLLLCTPFLLKKFLPVLPEIRLVIVILLIISLFLPLVFNRYLLKQIVMRKIRSRKEKLFEPDKDCIFVGIEDTHTFDKHKLAADDFGLLKITPDAIFLEMTAHRAQFRKTAIQVSPVYLGASSTGVRMLYNQSPYCWDVVLTPIAICHNVFAEMKSPRRTRCLLNQFSAAGVSTEEYSVPVVYPPEMAAHAECVPPPASISADSGIGSETPLDLTEKRYQDVAAIIRGDLKKNQRSWFKNIAILAISLVIFFQLGFFRWGFNFVLLLILVLLIHEMGHFLGMKIFGYRNVQMFFIPLIGAAVSGVSRNTAAWKKAIVSLLGPLPGLIISLILFILALWTSQRFYFNAGVVFLTINAFNLLPIFPLDGGRFMHQVLYSRNRYVEAAVHILTAIILLAAGAWMKSTLLNILGLFNFLAVRWQFKLAGFAGRFQKHMVEKNKDCTVDIRNSDDPDIPPHILKPMLNWLYQNMPGILKPETVATTASEIWDRIRICPPRLWATTGLLFLFFMGYVIFLISAGAATLGYYREFGNEKKIATCQEPNDPSSGYKEQTYFAGKLRQEIHLSKDQRFYHGFHKAYSHGRVVVQGQWDMGKRAGRWAFYDDPNTLTREAFYEDGKPVLRRILQDGGQWKEYQWNDFSTWEKRKYQRRAEKQQGPTGASDKPRKAFF